MSQRDQAIGTGGACLNNGAGIERSGAGERDGAGRGELSDVTGALKFTWIVVSRERRAAPLFTLMLVTAVAGAIVAVTGAMAMP